MKMEFYTNNYYYDFLKSFFDTAKFLSAMLSSNQVALRKP